MTERISRLELGMEVARLYASRATCLRGHNGAILLMDKRIVATGYNGPIIGQPQCTPETCNESGPCPNTVHAETNVIAFCSKYGIATNGTIMMCTTSPCKQCAKIIIQAGVHVVIYDFEYHDHSGLKLLEAASVLLYKYNPLLKIDW